MEPAAFQRILASSSEKYIKVPFVCASGVSNHQLELQVGGARRIGGKTEAIEY